MLGSSPHPADDSQGGPPAASSLSLNGFSSSARDTQQSQPEDTNANSQTAWLHPLEAEASADDFLFIDYEVNPKPQTLTPPNQTRIP